VGDCVEGQYPPVRPETSSCPEYTAHGSLIKSVRSKASKPSAQPTTRRSAEPVIHRRLPVDIEIDMDEATFRKVLREVLQEELSLSETPIAERYRGGELVLKAGKEGVQDKKVSLDGFFHKIVMIRDKLRVLEQKVNGSKLTDDEKVTLQQYITGCYGTLTTFNVLFRDEVDRFVGAADKG
jgi:hypothetical protein